MNDNSQIRQRQLYAALDKYVARNGNNLYPTRNEKEKMALQMGVTYNQVNIELELKKVLLGSLVTNGLGELPNFKTSNSRICMRLFDLISEF